MSEAQAAAYAAIYFPHLVPAIGRQLVRELWNLHHTTNKKEK